MKSFYPIWNIISQSVAQVFAMKYLLQREIDEIK